MKTVGVHEAKTHLSNLLETVEAGEEIIIARSGKPVAKLVPLKSSPRRPGRLKGKIKVHRDFDAPLPDEIARVFRGESS
jgi:prevent-host-death family protein